MSAQNDLPTGCNTDDGPTDGPALDDDGPNTDGDDRIGRRPFVKGLGAAAAASVALGLDDGPVGNAQAFPPALLPAAAAVGVIAYGELLAGPDDEAVDGALDYQNHLNEYTRAREDSMITDQTLTSLRRDVQLVENKAREEAIFNIYEAGVDSLSESDATAAAETAIQDAFATVEESILTSWTIRYQRYASLIGTDLVPEGSDTVLTSWNEHGSRRGVGNLGQFHGGGHTHTDYNLVDGSIKDVPYTHRERSDETVEFDPTREMVSDPADEAHIKRLAVTVPDHEDYEGVDEDTHDFTSPVFAIETEPWSKTYADLMDEYDNMMAEVSSMVDTYFGPAQDGEIDLHNLIGPAHLSDTASTAEDYQEAAMALRAMGYPISDQVCTVSIADPDDLDEDGDPVTQERTGRLSWTAHSGNTLAVGSELNPDNIVGSVFFAYNEEQPDGSTVGQTRELGRPFTVESAEGASGVSFEDRTLVEAETQLTNEEIQQLFEEHYEANEEARENVHDTATGGGGGLPEWDELSTGEKVVAVAITGGLAYGILN